MFAPFIPLTAECIYTVYVFSIDICKCQGKMLELLGNNLSIVGSEKCPSVLFGAL